MKKVLKSIVIFLLVFVFFQTIFSKYENVSIEENIRNGKRALENIPVFKKTVCEKTLSYSVGEIDERFGLSREEVQVVLAQAEKVWEEQMGMNLFEYDSESDFRVRFVFDERQKQSLESDSLTQNYEVLVERQGEISEKYQKMTEEYERLVSAYNDEIEEYENEVTEYNKEVSKWNNEGGAPEKEYEKLENKSKDLRSWYVDLEEDRDDINDLASEINKLAQKEGEMIVDYNKNVETYRERYGEAKEFNQGEYSQDGIAVYQFKGKQDLTLVLAHELGHALGLGHTENPKSIMYYLMEGQDLENIMLTQEDIQSLKTECEIK